MSLYVVLSQNPFEKSRYTTPTHYLKSLSIYPTLDVTQATWFKTMLTVCKVANRFFCHMIKHQYIELPRFHVDELDKLIEFLCCT